MNSNTLQHSSMTIDYPTLSSVKKEIQKSLDQAQSSLKSFVQNPDNETQMRFCITYLHQIFGTLQMVEITGAALLAEEMEKTAIALLTDTVSSREDTIDVLLQALTHLPPYLDSFDQGKNNAPILLTPVINQLRHSRAEELLSEVTLFNPDLTIKPPQVSPLENKTGKHIQAYAKKLRPVFQLTLLAWLKDKNNKSSIKKLAAVLRELQSISSSDDAQRSWWIMGGVIEALHDNGFSDSSPLMLLLSRMDNAIKRLIDNGEAAIIGNSNEDILKECLYYIGKSESSGPLVSDIKNSFSLVTQKDSLNNNSDTENHSANARDQNIPEELVTDLQELKYQMDNLINDFPQKPAAIRTISGRLKNISDAFEKLGCKQLKDEIGVQLATLSGILKNKQAVNDDVLLDIATSLIQAEDSLANQDPTSADWIQSRDNLLATHNPHEASKNQALAPITENGLNKLHHQLIQESLHTLAIIKDVLNNFSLQTSEAEEIASLPELLSQIKAAIVLIDFPRPAAIIGTINTYIKHKIIDTQQRPDGEHLDAIADAITSIELFFDALLNAHSNPEAVLTIAEISLEHLQPDIGGNITADASNPVNDAGDNKSHFYSEADLMPVFIEEAGDILQTSESIMGQWISKPAHHDHIPELLRLLHTLKGSARMAGISSIAAVSHNMESLLEAIAEERLPLIPDYQSLLQRCYDWMASALDCLKTNQSIAVADVLISEITDAVNRASTPSLLAQSDASDPFFDASVSASHHTAASNDEAKNKNSREIIGFIEEFSVSPVEENHTDDYIRIKSELVSQLIRQTGAINQDISQISTHIKEWYSCSNSSQHMHPSLHRQGHANAHAISTDHTNDFYTKIEALLSNQRNSTDQLLEALLNSRKIKFSSIFPRLRRIIRLACRETGKEVNLDFHGPDLDIDRVQLNHLTPLLEHIIRNAISHGIELPVVRKQIAKDAVGKIDLYISANETDITITISDDGAGINIEELRLLALKQEIIPPNSTLPDEDVLKLILKPGFTTVTAVTELSGRGLGLDVVNKGLEYLNGVLQIANHMGKGLSFTISIPTTPASPGETQNHNVSRNLQNTNTKPILEGGPLTVLVVDDSVTVLKLTSQILSANSYHPIVASNAYTALELVEQQSPNLILIDIEMPGMNGYELVQKIRKIVSPIDIPIIMITSHLGNIQRRLAFKAGVNIYMNKPFQEKELIENIQQLTSSKH